jgi:hypothetical protein
MGLLGDSWEDPRTAAILNLAGGLLSQRNLGAGLVQGMQGYTSSMLAAKKAQQDEEERKQIQAQRALQARMLEAQFADQMRAREEAAAAKQARGSFLDSIDPNAGPAMPVSIPQAMRAGLGLQEIQALMPAKAENPFGKVDPKDFTPESVRKFALTNNYSDLVPRTRVEFVDGRAVDPFATAPGTVLPRQSNPVADLLVPGPGGQLVPNKPLIDAKKQLVPPGTTVTVQPDSLGLKPKDRFDMELKLANDFGTAVKTDRGIVSVSQDLTNILKQPGAIKDQAAIYKFAKFLDPEGAVREADYAAIVKTSGGLDYVQQLFTRAMTGQQLSPKQRTEMDTLVRSMAAVAEKRIDSKKKRFGANARMYNLDPENVFQMSDEAPAMSLQDAAAAELARRQGGK